MLDHLERHGHASATPHPPPPQEVRPLMALSSGYVLRGEAQLPKQGDRAPWTLPQNWFTDRRAVRRARLDKELTFVARAGVSSRSS